MASCETVAGAFIATAVVVTADVVITAGAATQPLDG